MTSPAERLALLLQTTPVRLANISDHDASQVPGTGRWSKKEVLGHLIDSAGNNHQRFVRAQLADRLDFPEYQQEGWVAVQSYATESWPDLVNLWLLLNRHLVHIIRHIPETCLSRLCTIGGNEPIPLSQVIEGYLTHLEHHLKSLEDAAP